MQQKSLFFLSLYLLSCTTLPSHHTIKPAAGGLPWWKSAVFYEIYMPSYADSNGDGYGDFKGMTAKLHHLQSLGIKGIWLTPFLSSPKIDNGYDVADYYEVDTVYGNKQDFRNFLNEAHTRGIKVIMDMVLNHTSTDSKWFRASRQSVYSPYRDYYIWREEPNNWESFFGGSAWQFDSTTRQYYYHKFDSRMADLNWSNPAVVKEMHDVLRYWLNLGVDGFRLDVINFLTTDGIGSANPLKDGQQQHLFDINQPGVKAAMKGIKAVVSEYPGRFIVGEIGSDKIEVLKQYQSPELLDVVFNFNFGSLSGFNARRIFDELQSMEKNMTAYPTLFFGSHDMPRMLERLAGNDPARATALAALMLTAKGVPFIYYGEEIGMRNIIARSFDEMADIQGRTQFKIALDKTKDSTQALIAGNQHNRDKSRSPMQWDATAFAGFSTKQSWLTIPGDYPQVNVELQAAGTNSILQKYKALIAIRNREPALQLGSYERLEFDDGEILYSRKYAAEKITTIINFGADRTIVLPAGAKILLGATALRTNDFIIYKH